MTCGFEDFMPQGLKNTQNDYEGRRLFCAEARAEDKVVEIVFAADLSELNGRRHHAFRPRFCSTDNVISRCFLFFAYLPTPEISTSLHIETGFAQPEIHGSHLGQE